MSSVSVILLSQDYQLIPYLMFAGLLFFICFLCYFLEIEACSSLRSDGPGTSLHYREISMCLLSVVANTTALTDCTACFYLTTLAQYGLVLVYCIYIIKSWCQTVSKLSVVQQNTEQLTIHSWISLCYWDEKKLKKLSLDSTMGSTRRELSLDGCHILVSYKEKYTVFQ